jgi:Ca2+-dependent lipid-binding protein
MGVLTVHLDKVTHLKDDDGLGMGKSDPYVLFELEQDNLLLDKNFGTQKSSKKKDDCNPVYNETFKFNIPDKVGLKNVELTCKIMDDDIVGGMCLRMPEDLSWRVQTIPSG